MGADSAALVSSFVKRIQPGLGCERAVFALKTSATLQDHPAGVDRGSARAGPAMGGASAAPPREPGSRLLTASQLPGEPGRRAFRRSRARRSCHGGGHLEH